MLKVPEFNENGEQIISEINGINSDMLMNIKVKKFKAHDSALFYDEQNETAFMILSGELEIYFQGEKKVMKRESPFEKKPYCLHIPKQVEVEITAVLDSEIIIQQTDNDIVFTPVFYTPKDCTYEEFGKDQWGGAGHRVVSTIFDLSNAPYSNMVLGEVYNLPGKWSSYPPHYHPQPEVYYYKFDRPEGFGACFLGDDVHKSTDGSYCAIKGGSAHQQVVAPGFTMYYVWLIRHLDGNPWDKTRIYADGYEWLANSK